MSYRSDICIECEEKAFGMLYEVFEKYPNIYPEQIYKTEDNVYTMFWYYFAWYTCEKDVMALEQVVSELCSSEYIDVDGYGINFSIIGEDFNDVEIRNNDWYDYSVYIKREFSNPDGKLIYHEKYN